MEIVNGGGGGGSGREEEEEKKQKKKRRLHNAERKVSAFVPMCGIERKEKCLVIVI